MRQKGVALVVSKISMAYAVPLLVASDSQLYLEPLHISCVVTVILPKPDGNVRKQPFLPVIVWKELYDWFHK